MTTIVDPVEKLKRAGNGLTPTNVVVASTGDTHQVQNNGKMFLHFLKGNAVNAVVTFQTPGAVDGNAIAELTATVVGSTGDKFIGPFDPQIYNQIGQTYMQWTVSDVDGLTVAALSIDF